jgi:hypothetical protein
MSTKTIIILAVVAIVAWLILHFVTSNIPATTTSNPQNNLGNLLGGAVLSFENAISPLSTASTVTLPINGSVAQAYESPVVITNASTSYGADVDSAGNVLS